MKAAGGADAVKPASPEARRVAAGGPGTGWAWYGLAVLIGTTVFAYVDRQIIYLIAPSLQLRFGWTDLQLGVLQGLGLALFASVAGYPIGWLADRFGRRRVLAACVMVWSASTAAAAFQNSFSGLFAATVGIAVGEAALTPIIFAMIPDLFPERHRGNANFIFWGAAALGASAGLGLGGILLDWLSDHQQQLPGPLGAMESWRTALILVAAPAPLVLLLLTTIRMRPRTGLPAGSQDPGPDLDRIAPFARANMRMLLCLYGAVAAYGLPLMAGFIWLPVALPRIFGVAPATVGIEMGLVTAVAAIAGMALPAVGSRILRQSTILNSVRMAIVFSLLGTIPTLALPFASAAWQVYGLVGVQFSLGLAVGALMPGLVQLISPPGLRARLLVILGVVAALAQGLSPVFVGGISGMMDSPHGVLTALAIVGLPGWFLTAILMMFARRPLAAAVTAP
ncbi:MFS transporter [Sphingosinicella rhizophila]|uniref:MFS transporter n=1 Tax=Sphingosinicella rhizophila TaxID=3050082 RepID=A0ABU3QAP3_9SPHN|nr:MFS transporter [Sphingosinicella sp. GR2756]MDT9600073.1 MFS transporter [Sphingosinicella sp. GR2756]